MLESLFTEGGSVSVILGGLLGFLSQKIQNQKEIKQLELEVQDKQSQRDFELEMTKQNVKKLPLIHALENQEHLKRDITKPLITFYVLGLLTYFIVLVSTSIPLFEMNQIYNITLFILNIISFIIGKSVGWFFGAKQKEKKK